MNLEPKSSFADTILVTSQLNTHTKKMLLPPLVACHEVNKLNNEEATERDFCMLPPNERDKRLHCRSSSVLHRV